MSGKPDPSKIILISPISREVISYKPYEIRCIQDSLNRGEAPLTFRSLFGRAGKVMFSREVKSAFVWFKDVKLAVAYWDWGITEGMKSGIHIMGEMKCPIEYRKIGREVSKACITKL